MGTQEAPAQPGQRSTRRENLPRDRAGRYSATVEFWESFREGMLTRTAFWAVTGSLILAMGTGLFLVFFKQLKSPASNSMAGWRKVLEQWWSWLREIMSNGARKPWAAVGIALLLMMFVAWGILVHVLDPVKNTADPTPPSSSPGTSVTPIPQLTDGPEPGVSFTEAGWGPLRDTVSSISRNSIVTLNSMIDNPAHGDERNFAQVKGADEANADYREKIVASPGANYTGYIYFNNDADPNSTGSVAQDTVLKISMPGAATGSASVYGTITSSSAVPGEVWDGFNVLLADPTEQFALRYVEGSAVIYSGGAVNGTALSDDLFRDGVRLGCDELDGNLPSSTECAGYVTFSFRVDQPNFEVVAEARKKGADSSYTDNVEVKSGEVVQVRVMYQNQGSTQQDNVGLIVAIPDGFRYIKGSSEIWNSTTANKASDDRKVVDGIASTGLNIGSYQPQGNAWIRFDVMVDDLSLAPFKGPWLGVDPFVTVTTSSGSKSDSLTFLLTK
jgi:hypothetical protein